MSLTSLPPDSTRQLLGAPNMPWKIPLEYGPEVLSLVTPIAQRLFWAFERALQRRLKSSAVLSGPTLAWSIRPWFASMPGPVSGCTVGTPASAPFLIGTFHDALAKFARLGYSFTPSPLR